MKHVTEFDQPRNPIHRQKSKSEANQGNDCNQTNEKQFLYEISKSKDSKTKVNLTDLLMVRITPSLMFSLKCN